MTEKAKKVVVNINVVSSNRESISKCLEEVARIVKSKTTFCAGECVSQTSEGVVSAAFDLKVLEVKED